MNTAVVNHLTATPEMISAPVIASIGAAKIDGVVPPTPPAVEVKGNIVKEMDLKKDVKDNNLTATPELISAPIIASNVAAKIDGVVPPTPPAVEVKGNIVEEMDLKKNMKDDSDDMIPVACDVPKIDRTKKFNYANVKGAQKPCPFCLKSVFSVERIVCGTTGWHRSCLGKKYRKRIFFATELRLKLLLLP